MWHYLAGIPKADICFRIVQMIYPNDFLGCVNFNEVGGDPRGLIAILFCLLACLGSWVSRLAKSPQQVPPQNPFKAHKPYWLFVTARNLFAEWHACLDTWRIEKMAQKKCVSLICQNALQLEWESHQLTARRSHRGYTVYSQRSHTPHWIFSLDWTMYFIQTDQVEPTITR
jgi:hypothetical protein